MYARSNFVESNPRYQAAVAEQRRREQAKLEARKPSQRLAVFAHPEFTAEELEEQRKERDRRMFEEAAQKFPIAAADDQNTVRGIIARVAAEHGLKSADLTGPSHARKFIGPRHEAIYRVWIEKDPIGLAEIGRYFNRDHTTILSALRKRGVTDTRQRTCKSVEAQHE